MWFNRMVLITSTVTVSGKWISVAGRLVPFMKSETMTLGHLLFIAAIISMGFGASSVDVTLVGIALARETATAGGSGILCSMWFAFNPSG